MARRTTNVMCCNGILHLRRRKFYLCMLFLWLKPQAIQEASLWLANSALTELRADFFLIGPVYPEEANEVSASKNIQVKR